MEEESRRLREALRFYADPEHWLTTLQDSWGRWRDAAGARMCGNESMQHLVCAAHLDGGKIARKALETEGWHE